MYVMCVKYMGKCGCVCHVGMDVGVYPLIPLRDTFLFQRFMYLFEGERQRGEGQGESQAESPLSMEPETGLALRTLRS